MRFIAFVLFVISTAFAFVPPVDFWSGANLACAVYGLVVLIKEPWE